MGSSPWAGAVGAAALAARAATKPSLDTLGVMHVNAAAVVIMPMAPVDATAVLLPEMSTVPLMSYLGRVDVAKVRMAAASQATRQTLPVVLLVRDQLMVAGLMLRLAGVQISMWDLPARRGPRRGTLRLDLPLASSLELLAKTYAVSAPLRSFLSSCGRHPRVRRSAVVVRRH